MISPKAIKQQAERWWKAVLRASLQGEAYFPKSLTRINKVKSQERLQDFDRIRAEQQALMTGCKTRNGSGYTVHWEERNYRDIGRNKFVSGISIDSLEDYLAILQRSTIYRRFLADYQLIQSTIPQLQTWCTDHPLEIEAHHGLWSDLLRVIRYFMHEHQIGKYYIRELPLAIPTKFVETHRRILGSMLDEVLSPAQINEHYRGVKQFEQRYGLKYRQTMVRLRLLDQAIAEQYFYGLSDLAIPLGDFGQLSLPLDRVIILENKTNYTNLMNFLTLPQLERAAGLFGSGFSLGKFKNVDWLHQVEILYWGDLDAHGLQILSQLRSYFPHTRSFLMDRVTFDAFPDYVLEDAPSSKVVMLPHLTAEEQSLFEYLNANRLRLEQERIPLSYVSEQLKFE